MVKIEHSVTVARPVSEVFAYLTDLRKLPEWQGGTTAVRPETEGPTSVGSRFVQVAKFLGRQMDSTLEVTEYEPDRTFTVRTLSGPVPFTVRHTFEESDGATRIDVLGEGEPGGFFKMAEPLVARRAKQTIERDFATLKEVLEARA